MNSRDPIPSSSDAAREADAVLLPEDEEAFLVRRADEERQRIAETSCVVRSVHEELVEAYEERLHAADADKQAMERLLASLADV